MENLIVTYKQNNFEKLINKTKYYLDPKNIQEKKK